MKASFKNSAPTIPGTRAVQRVLSLLKAFPEDSPRQSLTELAVNVGLDKATALRMLRVLEQEGFVYRSPETGEYQLGSEVIVLGARALGAVDIRKVARPEIEALAEVTGVDSTLEALVGSEVLILDEARGESLLSLGTEVGSRWPVHATATGKVLLAFGEGEMPEPPGGLPALTDHTIVSWDEWLKVLSEVREQGYATNIEELEYGYASVAAPVRDRDGRTTASLSVGGPVHRVTRERMPALAVRVQEAAARLSERLGYRSASAGGPTLASHPEPGTRSNETDPPFS
jgi:DNA-binding IclR family transcriptional regulator